jgi:hypothetical protein
LTSDGKDIFFNGDKAVCFHVHALKKLDYTNYGKFLLDKVIGLMKQCNNEKYHEIVKFIEANLEDSK